MRSINPALQAVVDSHRGRGWLLTGLSSPLLLFLLVAVLVPPVTFETSAGLAILAIAPAVVLRLGIRRFRRAREITRAAHWLATERADALADISPPARGSTRVLVSIRTFEEGVASVVPEAAYCLGIEGDFGAVADLYVIELDAAVAVVGRECYGLTRHGAVDRPEHVVLSRHGEFAMLRLDGRRMLLFNGFLVDSLGTTHRSYIPDLTDRMRIDVPAYLSRVAIVFLVWQLTSDWMQRRTAKGRAERVSSGAEYAGDSGGGGG